MASTAGVQATGRAQREAALDEAASTLVSGTAPTCEACNAPMAPADVGRLSPRPLCVSCARA